ncbi:DUF2809 domain-containing protein [Isoptericola sp. BMS4]|uniref:DUF2809 domain-containing protein n=1 Tax=Isoptericola sp. BMS4 TaxID=2527875 RepID=UPI00141EF424|nr:DUF2809 domain-containing protein [Isoptericola sp. BMS4]
MAPPDDPGTDATPPARAPRVTTAVLAAVVLLAGLGARAVLPAAVGGPAGDTLYATLAVLLVALVVRRPLPAALLGLVLCAAVEALQLTDLPGRAADAVPQARYVLGSTFHAPDLGWYALGAAVGWAALALAVPARRHERHTRSAPRRGRLALLLVPVVALGAAGGELAASMGAEADALAVAVADGEDALTGSEGRVDDESVRDAMAESLDDARAVLSATPVLERRPGAATRARERVADAADALLDSRHQFARSQANATRDALAEFTARGDTVLAATEGLGAPRAPREALRSALESADTALAAAAPTLLDAAELAEIEQITAELADGVPAVEQATTALMTAQDAVTCPEDDQLWFPGAGRLADDELAAIPWDPEYSVRADVLDGLVALDEAYRARFGEHLTINSAYRSYEQQVAVYNPADPNPLAAPPGCSNHGLGTAVDLGGGVQTFGSAQYEWLKAHAAEHGWTHPGWAEPDGRLPEAWHWQSVETPETY